MDKRRAWASGILVALIGCGGGGTADSDPPPWYGDFPVGDHQVGFRTTTLTRAGPEGPRELALSVWYPAVSSPGVESLRLADYLRLVILEGQLSETEGLAEEPALAAAMTGSATALTAERSRSGLDAPTLAGADAVPSAGPYPLALWSSRHATVLAQAPIAEVLASHGFVVATVWSSEPPLAFLWEERSAEEKLATIEAHTGDLARALEELRLDPSVDGDNVVVLAWSYGGQTAARLQEREPGVRGVVALDANVLPARAEETLELKRPLVYLVGRDTSGRGFDRLEHLSEPWIAVRFEELAHGNFNALEGYLPAALGADTVYAWSRGGQVARDGYRALTEVVVTAAGMMVGEVPPLMSELAVHLEEAAGGAPIEVRTPATVRDP